jgi:hypothetical protein
MRTPLNPDRQDAYYDWLAQQEKEENEARRRLVNPDDEDDTEETRESILRSMYPNAEPGEEIELDDND